MKLFATSLMLAMSICFCSCGEKEIIDSEKPIETQTAVTDESLNGAPDYGETIDIDELVTKITVDGEPIPFPFTVKDLKEGWSLKQTKIHYAYSLYIDDVYVGLLQSFQDPLPDYDEIIFDNISNMSIISTWEISGFSRQDNAEELLKAFGNPTRYLTEYNLEDMEFEYETEKNYIHIWVRYGKISLISIYNLEI